MSIDDQISKMDGHEIVEDVAEQNSEMIDFLQYFNVEERNLKDSILQLERNVDAIRTHIESKSKKITMKQLNEKLEKIIQILNQNGLVCKW